MGYILAKYLQPAYFHTLINHLKSGHSEECDLDCSPYHPMENVATKIGNSMLCRLVAELAGKAD